MGSVYLRFPLCFLALLIGASTFVTAQDCSTPANVVFALSDTKLSENDYMRVIEFLTSLVDRMEVSEKNKQVGFVQVTNLGTTKVDMSGQSNGEMKNTLQRLTRQNGELDINGYDGLFREISEMFDMGRQDIDNVIVMISSNGKDNIRELALAGKRTFTIGIMVGAVQKRDDEYFTASSYKDLQSLTRDVHAAICNNKKDVNDNLLTMASEGAYITPHGEIVIVDGAYIRAGLKDPKKKFDKKGRKRCVPVFETSFTDGWEHNKLIDKFTRVIVKGDGAHFSSRSSILISKSVQKKMKRSFTILMRIIPDAFGDLCEFILTNDGCDSKMTLMLGLDAKLSSLVLKVAIGKTTSRLLFVKYWEKSANKVLISYDGHKLTLKVNDLAVSSKISGRFEATFCPISVGSLSLHADIRGFTGIIDFLKIYPCIPKKKHL